MSLANVFVLLAVLCFILAAARSRWTTGQSDQSRPRVRRLVAARWRGAARLMGTSIPAKVGEALSKAINHRREQLLFAKHPRAPWSMEFLRRIGAT